MEEDKKIVPKLSSLAEQPEDIVVLIAHKLSLGSKIILAQTCKSLYSMLSARCTSTVQSLQPNERWELLRTLEILLPNYRIFNECRALHFVDHEDLPTRDRSRPIISWKQRFGYEYDHNSIPGYVLSRRHVQLAIKYSRRPGLHDNYRANLLKPYSCSRSDLLGMQVDCAAEPVIVLNRFILKLSVDIEKRSGPVTFEDLSYLEVKVCPYLKCRVGNACSSECIVQKRLGWAVEATKRKKGFGHSFESTIWPPSDFTIITKPGKLSFHMLHDLGNGEGTSDKFWGNHSKVLLSNDDAHCDFQVGSVVERFHRGRTLQFVEPLPVIETSSPAESLPDDESSLQSETDSEEERWLEEEWNKDDDYYTTVTSTQCDGHSSTCLTSILVSNVWWPSGLSSFELPVSYICRYPGCKAFEQPAAWKTLP